MQRNDRHISRAAVQTSAATASARSGSSRKRRLRTAFMAAMPKMTSANVFGLVAVLMMLGALAAPQSAFSIDDVVYIDMAHAMAERGALTATYENAPAGSPVLTKSDGIIRVINEQAVPQYPAGYALLAAPFFKLFGVSGLIMLNALAGALSLWLTYLIALRLYGNQEIARFAALLLGLATIFSGYVFAVWPHMTALAALLGGALFTLKTAEASGMRRIRDALIAGFIFGLGLSFRVDIIVPFAAALFWLRLFALPDDRSSALALLAGTLPGVIFAAYLNLEKFGVFLPIYYGPTEGGHKIVEYAPFAVIGLGAIAASFVISTNHKSVQRMAKTPIAIWGAVLSAGILIAILVAGDTLWKFLYGFYFLTVDIQAYNNAAPQAGLVRDDYGYWSFWGLPKKSLVQSMPFIALAILPAIEFFRGKNARAHAFSLMMIAAPVVFFSLKAFHGGMALNMRYLLPAAPFLAALAAHALAGFRPVMKRHPKILLRGIMGGFFAAILFYQFLPSEMARLATPLQLYPQIALFTALSCALTYYLWTRQNARVGFVVVALSGAAFGYSMLLSASDLGGYLGIRANKTPYEQTYKAAIPPGSLVVTTAEDYLVHASINGVHVARANIADRTQLTDAITTYENHNRCVYIHTDSAMKILSDERFIPAAIPGVAVQNGGLAFFALRGQAPACRLTRLNAM